MTDGRFLISTDDAYVEGDIAVIAPKVAGYVEKGQRDREPEGEGGDPLVSLDQGDYLLALEKAHANVESARLLSAALMRKSSARSKCGAAQAQLGALQATVGGAEITQKRTAELASRNVGTTADLDNAPIALEQAQANLKAGRQRSPLRRQTLNVEGAAQRGDEYHQLQQLAVISQARSQFHSAEGTV